MNVLDTERRARVVRCLVEGNSIRSTSRMTGVARNTVSKLLLDLGRVCSEYQDRALRNLPCKRIQVDEVWCFVYAKQKNVTEKIARERVAGDVWTWTAIDADTKLVPCWFIGQRDAVAATEFIADLEMRLANRIQLTSDGLRVYVNAVIDAFADEIDYAQLVKIYGTMDVEGQRRYTPAPCIAARPEAILGDPDRKHISTSYVERQNLTMRMSMRRFTRLTNAFSKKVEYHAASVALHFMWYNFGKVHQTLKTSPAVKAGVSDHVWSMGEVIGLLDQQAKAASN